MNTTKIDTAAERAALLPCPFCGGEASLEAHYGREWWVQCSRDHSTGILHRSPAEAEEEWNRRASAAPAPVVPADSRDQALGLYVAQAEAICALLDKHAPDTHGNLQTRLAQALTRGSRIDADKLQRGTEPFAFHWLVELRPAFDHHPPFPATYYAGWMDGIEPAKTTDPMEAVRFTSKDHAERIATRLGFTLSCVWKAVEHGFATDQADRDARHAAAELVSDALGGGRASQEPSIEDRAWVLAQNFHATYERLAPSFGYQTRPETRGWVADSPNGKLMRAVCAELIQRGLIACATRALDSSRGGER